jgi:hypothetical protein
LLSSLTPCNTSSFPTSSVQLILHIFLQHHTAKFPGISYLLSEVSKIQHRTELCSICIILSVSSLNLSPIS